jgi:hypothetical protein
MPLKPHPTDPDKMVYVNREYDLPQPEREPRLDQGPDYERGFIDGMQKQMQSSVDKAVNAMSQRTWIDLTHKQFAEILCDDRWQCRPELMMLRVQQLLKELNK